MNSTYESLRKVGVPEHLITRIFLLTTARPGGLIGLGRKESER
jgi:hypothetical protein